MGRTKRLRKRKGADLALVKCSSAISLYNYLGGFGWRNHTNLICHNFDTTGRGLCSKTSICSGEVLMKLPLKAMITLKTLENDKGFRGTIEDRLPSNSVSFHSLLAFYILYRNHAIDSTSNLKLYLDSIPKAFTTPYFCRSEELYYLPEEILQCTVRQNKKIRDSYNIFQTIFGDKICKCCARSYMPEIFTLTDFKWAYFVINSRSVYLGTGKNNIAKSQSFLQKSLTNEPDMALAPFLDLFNHSDTAVTEADIVSENDGSLTYQLKTHNSYKPYEQIFISYGKLTNLQLLTEYGFSTEQNANDYFNFTLSDIESLIKNDPTFQNVHYHRNKFKFIRDHNLNDQMFIHALNGLSHNLQVTLYLIFKEPSHFPNVLNQTAFGSNTSFEESIQKEVELLILCKIREYQSFIDGYRRIKELSPSGKVVMQYLTQSISYLQSFRKSNFI